MTDLIISPVSARLEIENKAAFAAAIAELAEHYAVVVEDKAQAKKDRATVNKMLKAIDDKRKETKREYEAPFKAFEAELKELSKPLEEARDEIDRQIKVIEDGEREERRRAIEAEYAKLPTSIPLQAVWSDKWLNLSKSLSECVGEMTIALMTAQNAKPMPAVDCQPTMSAMPNGVPVFDFTQNAKTRTLMITATLAQQDIIDEFLTKLGVFFVEV